MASSFTPRSRPILILPKKNTSGSTIPQGTPVKLDTATDDGMAACAAATDKVIGIVLHDVLDKDYGEVGVIGVFPVLAAGTIHRGDRVGLNSSGAAITQTTDHNSLIGISQREALSTELFECLVNCAGATLSA